MEQERRELTLSLQLPDQTHLKCPRCKSTNTKFRYYNNHRVSQPRHQCRGCRRMWTVGGKLRDIPIGGGSYNRPYRQLAPLPLADQLENANSQPSMAEMVPQNVGPTGTQPISISTEPQSPFPSFYLNDEISVPVESLIQQNTIVGPTVPTGILLGSGSVSADMSFMLDWDVKPMGSPQVVMGQPVNIGNQFAGGADDMAFHIKPEPVVSDQPLPQGYIGQANNYATSYQGPDYNLVQPTFDMNVLPQDSINDFFLSSPNGGLWMNRNSGGNTTDAGMPSTSANPNQWTKFPGYGSE